MRLVDTIFRQGHLSEQTLVEAIVTGERPVHLDRCDLCAERAMELSRWLEAVRGAAVDAADEAFPAERLAAQQAQILRRIEQLDEPARVIAFPSQSRLTQRESGRRRVAPAWIGVAAAAGLVIGAIGGQVSARLESQSSARAPLAPAPAVATPAPDPQAVIPANASLLDMDLDTFTPAALGPMNDMTPKIVAVSNVRTARTR